MYKFFKSFDKYYVSRNFDNLKHLVRTHNGLVAFDDYFESLDFLLNNSSATVVHINGKC